jgi:hypothetical protein
MDRSRDRGGDIDRNSALGGGRRAWHDGDSGKTPLMEMGRKGIAKTPVTRQRGREFRLRL